jgi:hypothetical protein
MKILFGHWRFIVTDGITLVAAGRSAGWQLWRHYEVEPWTRDGRVKAYVVQVAPDVTGQVTARCYVHDNQQVKAGRYRCSKSTARASSWRCARRSPGAGAQAALAQAQRESKRNTQLRRPGLAGDPRAGPDPRRPGCAPPWPRPSVNRDTAKLNLDAHPRGVGGGRHRHQPRPARRRLRERRRIR